MGTYVEAFQTIPNLSEYVVSTYYPVPLGFDMNAEDYLAECLNDGVSLPTDEHYMLGPDEDGVFSLWQYAGR